MSAGSEVGVAYFGSSSHAIQAVSIDVNLCQSIKRGVPRYLLPNAVKDLAFAVELLMLRGRVDRKGGSET